MRYRPPASGGDRQPFPTVATTRAWAYAAVKKIALRPGATSIGLNGGMAVIDPAHHDSVYLAYPARTSR